MNKACEAFIETSLANGHDCGFIGPCEALGAREGEALKPTREQLFEIIKSAGIELIPTAYGLAWRLARPAPEALPYADGLEDAAKIADEVCAKSRNHLFRSAAKIIAGTIRDTAPERIYLVVGDVPENADFQYLSDVTWCADSQFDTDIEYVRTDIATEALGAAKGVELSDAEIQAAWDVACQDSPSKPGWCRHIRFAHAILAKAKGEQA